MSKQTEIEWCDATFNPWIGCTKDDANGNKVGKKQAGRLLLGNEYNGFPA